jgi:hypothetical protein
MLLVLLPLLGCQGETVTSAPRNSPLAGVPAARLEALSGARIYFGHQSVGYNLVGGLQAVAKDRPELKLRFVETRRADDLRPGTFAHAENGHNVKPLTKIRDFAETLDGGVGKNVDVAFFKFCYVDFGPASEVEPVFAEYKATLAGLRGRYPQVRFVHVTTPLTTVPSGWKESVKRLLGRGSKDAEANVAREHFNALMRAEYGGREPLFDLAAVEATRPDGARTTFDLGGPQPALTPAYASDEGHLNAAGARWAAEHLLVTLASASGR